MSYIAQDVHLYCHDRHYNTEKISVLILAQLYSKLKMYAYLREPEEHHVPWAAIHIAGVLNACEVVPLHGRLPRQPIALCTSMGMFAVDCTLDSPGLERLYTSSAPYCGT
jgi:hypothetical protein